MVGSSQAPVATSLARPVCTVAIKAPATHTDSDEQRRMAVLVGLVVFGKDALLAAVIVFQLGNFGRDAFQLDIEPKQSA